MKVQLISAAIAATLLFATQANAGELVLVNRDAPGTGLNDTTPANPIGGNPGRTVGEQRVLVYRFAMDLWGSVLQNELPINVGASFSALACTATSGTLGSAGPSWAANNFQNAPLSNTAYPGALAKAISGLPYDQFATDISSNFNSMLGTENCLNGSGWYYGVDGNAPDNRTSFLDVVMHEIAHGLGVVGFVDYTTGVLGGRGGFAGMADVYTHHAFDNVRNLRFTDAAMTNADRAAAIRTPGRPGWDGPNVRAQAPLWLDPALVLQVNGTGVSFSNQFFSTAAFGPAAVAANFNAPLVMVNDGVGDTGDACEPLPAGSLTGRIAFINRGTCSFEPKTVNAQNAGAVGVIIGNVATSGDRFDAPTMADDATVVATIPAISLGVTSANTLRTALAAGTNLTASLNQTAGRLRGADAAGRPLLYAPEIVAGGSSFSHYERILLPNALMEPAINGSLTANTIVDLTLPLFADEGWQLNAGTARINDCDTGVNMFTNPGILAGANLVASSNICRVEANGNRVRYLSCVDGRARELQALNMITAAQKASVRLCASKVTGL